MEIFRLQTRTAAPVPAAVEDAGAEGSSEEQQLPSCSIAALIQTVEQLVEEMEAMPEIPDRSDHCCVLTYTMDRFAEHLRQVAQRQSAS